MKQLSYIYVLLLSISSVALATETPMQATTAENANETAAQTPMDSMSNMGSEQAAENTTETMAAEQQAAPAVEYSEKNIARTAFTHGVENREPVDKVGQLTNDNEKIYFFTEIKGMSGQTVIHRWEHAGDIKAEVSFKVGSDRWRVWSSKNLQPGWVGEWIVSVVDGNGKTLTEESMAYVPAEKTAPASNEETAPMNSPADPAATDAPESPAIN